MISRSSSTSPEAASATAVVVDVLSGIARYGAAGTALALHAYATDCPSASGCDTLFLLN